MTQYFSTLTVLGLSMMGVLAPQVKADEWNKKTNITINRSIDVEGTVLPAGSYVLKLVDLPSDRHLVQILSEKENRVVATVFTASAYRVTPADKSEFTFYESEDEQPPALRTWFYPGDPIGFEFRANGGRRAVVSAHRSATPPSGSAN